MLPGIKKNSESQEIPMIDAMRKTLSIMPGRISGFSVFADEHKNHFLRK
jgi:hypothetical protein